MKDTFHPGPVRFILDAVFCEPTALPNSTALLEQILHPAIGVEQSFLVLDRDRWIQTLGEKLDPDSLSVECRGDVANSVEGTTVGVEIVLIHSPSGKFLRSFYPVDVERHSNVEAFHKLLDQTHWHVVVLDRRGSVVALLETPRDDSMCDKFAAAAYMRMRRPVDALREVKRLWSRIRDRPLRQSAGQDIEGRCD